MIKWEPRFMQTRLSGENWCIRYRNFSLTRLFGLKSCRKVRQEREVTTCTTGMCWWSIAKVRGVACRVSGKTEGYFCTVFGTYGRYRGQSRAQIRETFKNLSWEKHRDAALSLKYGDRRGSLAFLPLYRSCLNSVQVHFYSIWTL